MTIEKFNDIVHKQIDTCTNMLICKGREYAPQTMSEAEKITYVGGVEHEINISGNKDRLMHFKKAAAIMGTTPKVALLGMFSKHIVSVSDMCASHKEYPVEKWNEKITDSINYLLILRAIVEEERNE